MQPDSSRHYAGALGPGRGGVEVGSTLLRVRMAGFHLDIPDTFWPGGCLPIAHPWLAVATWGGG